ncbi:hypothetical protein C0J52_18202, partial [Blattella germanica]
GDITSPDLGISPSDQKLLFGNVSVVFHSAASVKFDEVLKESVKMNLIAPKRILQLCHKMAQLEFIKLSKTWREPIPGWVDNINGPTGLIAGVGKGLLRTMMCNRNFVADLIPVDVAINLMISVAWHTATTRPSSIQVYHCATGTLNPITWAEIEEIGYKIIINNPFNDIIWYPGGSFKSSRILNKICVFMFQFIPACALDFMSRMTGKKPVMMRLHRRLQSVMSYIEFFTTREWKFDSENVKRLRTHLHPRDLTIFNFDVMNLEWRKYLEQGREDVHQKRGAGRPQSARDDVHVNAVRALLEEHPREVGVAPGKILHILKKKMFIVHQLSKFLLLLLAWKVVMLHSDTARQLWFTMFNLVLRITHFLPQLCQPNSAKDAISTVL